MSLTAAHPAHIKAAYKRLLAVYGPQGWWPGDSPFEIMVGAVLVQNTAWRNAAKAIANLKQVDHLDADAIANTTPAQLAIWLRPSGYFNIKAQRLRDFCRWYLERGGFESLTRLETPRLRGALLEVTGVGPETADDMLLYAFDRRVFVIDAYTRRLFARLGIIGGQEGYETLRNVFEQALRGEDLHVYKELHALIVHHGKLMCRKAPVCTNCFLSNRCPAARRGSK